MARAPKATETADAAEPKTLGDVLDQMPINPEPETQTNEPQSPAVYRAIAMIINDLGKEGIGKEKEATQGGKFKYRSVDQVYAALSPLLVQHGLVILPRYHGHKQVVRTMSSGALLQFTVVEADFDFVSTLDGSHHRVSTLGEAMDSGDKSTNKAMAVAFKYAAFITFCIPVEGEDNDPDAHQSEQLGRGEPPQQRQREPEPPRETAAEKQERMRLVAKAEFDRAEALMRACTTLRALDEVWNNQIDWDKVPKSWHPHYQKVNTEMVEQIKNPPRSAPTTSAPAFDSGSLDDDIPF